MFRFCSLTPLAYELHRPSEEYQKYDAQEKQATGGHEAFDAVKVKSENGHGHGAKRDSKNSKWERRTKKQIFSYFVCYAMHFLLTCCYRYRYCYC